MTSAAPEVALGGLPLVSAADELIAAPPARAIRLSVLAAVILVLIAIRAAAFYRIDVYATAPGRIQPVGRSKSVQAPEQATVRAIYVREGQAIRQGQILIRLDPTAAIFDREAAREQELSLTGEIVRRRAEMDMRNAVDQPRIDFPDEVPATVRAREEEALRSDLAQLRGEHAVFLARIASDRLRASALGAASEQHGLLVRSAQQKLASRRQLAAEGWRSGTDVLDAEADMAKAGAERFSALQEASAAGADIVEQQAEITASFGKMLKDNADQLEQAEDKRSQVEQSFLKNRSRTDQLVIRAPVSGTVQGLAITNVGQVANVGEAMMTIVPAAALVQVEALVSDRDVGFIKAGQAVVVKVRAYPYTRYGVLEGRVTAIAHDSISSRDATDATDTSTTAKPYDDPNEAPLPHVQDLVYPVVISIDRASLDVDGVDTPMRPGMATEVEIKTARRSVLEYLFSPLVQTLSDSAHEQ